MGTIMSERSTAASDKTGEETGSPVDVPAGIRDERLERDETTPGTVDLPGGGTDDDPADPTSPVHPDR